MSKKNGQPMISREKILELIAAFREREAEAQEELEAALQELENYKAAKRREVMAEYDDLPPDALPVMGITIDLRDDYEFDHLEHLRGRAGAKLEDIRDRIGKLKKALQLTPE